MCSKHDCRRFQNQLRRLRPPRRYISSYKGHFVCPPGSSRVPCVPTSTSQPAVLSLSRFPTRRLFSDLEVHTRPRLPNITKFRSGSRASVASAGGRYLCAQSLPLRTVAFAWTSPACIGGCSVPSSHCSIALAPPPPPPPPREVSS